MADEIGKMEARPPELMARAAHFLIPSAMREEICGDLCERYKSPLQYIKEVFSMLPHLIAGQIRRNTNLSLLGVQAFLLFSVSADLLPPAMPRPSMYRAGFAPRRLCLLRLAPFCSATPIAKTPIAPLGGPVSIV
nr:MAG: hypothetical protein E4H34_02400 [Hyphomicrobiales bacterium]